MRRTRLILPLMIASLLSLTACAGTERSADATTVSNCGRRVSVEGRPDRVIALGPSEVTTLVAAGAAAKLVGRDDAGEKSDPYTPQIRDAVAAVPQLGTGGDISREALVAKRPDLVVGSVSETISPATLSAVGIPMFSLRGNCGSNHAPGASDGTADFADVASDVNTLGTLLGTSRQADRWVSQARERVAAAKRHADLQGRSAAAVIVFEDDLEIYGRRSMAHTQLTSLGATDVFADADKRVFQASIEELIRRDPDTVVLLSYGQSDTEAREAFLRLPGVERLAAARANRIFVQPYEYSSQGVLAVNGLENMAAHFPAS